MTARMLAAAALIALAGCAPPPPADDIDGPPSEVDSLLVLENLVDDPGAAETVLSDLKTRTEHHPARRPTSAVGRKRRLSWRLTAVDGYRSDLKAALGLEDIVTCGLRVGAPSPVGYIRLNGRGPVGAVHIGYLSARMGERLVLGRSLGMYPMIALAPVAEGMAVSPSLSRWFGRVGVSVGLEPGPFEARLLYVGTAGPATGPDPGALWLVIGAARGPWRAGAAYAGALPNLGGRALRRFARAPGVVSTHAVYRDGGVEGSTELAVYPGGKPYLAARISYRARPVRWEMLGFRAPYFSSSVDPLVDFARPERSNQGARLDVSLRTAGRKFAFSLILGRLISPLERRTYRRCRLILTGDSRRPLFWEFTVDHAQECEFKYSKNLIDRTGQSERTDKTRGRISLKLNDDGAFSHELRIDAMRLTAGDAGILVSAGSTLAGPSLELRWQASAWSLPPGGRGYTVRPGVGGFEFFSAVYGGGSDVSVRFRWRIRDGLTAVLYHGGAWLRDNRIYVGLDWRR